ncbi:PXR1 [Candida pseudojiufengensis]|uniref:PXR1 n=1 Tax=Candida pseudojiufengensis TaxID=497109 RepID=UPI0022243F12|nr:PXR1 [Candida pseudojiufengensis]KAI5965802.1 PXR1 [Candida pseudojiufengensis]
MGLAGTKVKQNFGLDPRNTNWSNDTSRFGHQYLSKMGWKTGKGLGLTPNSMTSHIKIHIKQDNSGLGAKLKKSNEDKSLDECSGLDAFQRILGRLNGNENKVNKIMDLKKNDEIINGKWGIRFVKGEVLSSTWDKDSKKLISYKNTDENSSKKRNMEEDEDDDEIKTTNEHKETEDDIRQSKKIKLDSKEKEDKRKSKEDRKDKKKKEKRKSKTKEEDERSSKKEKKEKKSSKTNEEDEISNKKEKKEKKSSKTEDDEISSKKVKKEKKDKVDKDPSSKVKKEKKEKEKIKETKSEETQEPKSSSSTPTPSSGLASRHSARSKWIKQKRASVMDPKALNEIFMISK